MILVEREEKRKRWRRINTFTVQAASQNTTPPRCWDHSRGRTRGILPATAPLMAHGIWESRSEMLYSIRLDLLSDAGLQDRGVGKI